MLIATHVLARDNLSLLPVALLTEVDTNRAHQKICNPYYDYSIEGMDPYIDTDELERLTQHSKLTLDVSDTKKRYETYLNDKSNLLGHLRQLCLQLTFNSVAGIGAEKDAGSGVYAAIQAFTEYYILLEEKQKYIPFLLKTELDKLIALSSNTDLNVQAAENLDTCIATRRAMIEEAMSGYEETLMDIGIGDGETKTRLLQETSGQFLAAKQSLSNALKDKYYPHGCDKLSITVPLLQKLNVPITINSNHDLDALKLLTPIELTAVFQQDASLKNQFLTQIDFLENLVIFALEIAPNKLRVIFNAITALLPLDIIGSGSELAGLLMSLDEERSQIICDAMKSELSEIIQTANGFMDTLEHLSTKQRSRIFEIIQSDLLKKIHSASDFNATLAYLNIEERIIVFNKIQKKLPQLISTVEGIELILAYLDERQSIKFLTSIHDKVLQTISSVTDFTEMMELLTPSQQSVFFLQIKEKLPLLITSAQDFVDILSQLSLTKKAIVFRGIRIKLPSMIHSEEDFLLVFQELNLILRSQFFDAVKINFPEIITSVFDFNAVFKCFTLKYRADAFQLIQDYLPSLINTPEEFDLVFKHLTPTQCAVICDAMTARLPAIIKSTSDLCRVLKYLDQPECLKVCLTIMDYYPNRITSIAALDRVLQYLNPEQCNIFCQKIRKNLIRLLPRVSDLLELYELTPQNYFIVLTVIKTRVPGIIENVHDFYAVFSVLTHEQRTQFNDAYITNKLLALIKPYSIKETLNVIANWHEGFSRYQQLIFIEIKLKLFKQATHLLSFLAYDKSIQPYVQTTEEAISRANTIANFNDIETELNNKETHLQKFATTATEQCSRYGFFTPSETSENTDLHFRQGVFSEPVAKRCKHS